jgi:segregation and condensation protein B
MEREESRGWVIVRHKDSVHLASAPRFANQVRRFLGMERESRLSGAALETLALVAYRQPVTRAEIEALRGVDSSGVLATLHARGLIEIAGRLPTVGNPIQYATSIDFLRQFGLQSLADLPALGALSDAASERLLQPLPDDLQPRASTLGEDVDVV